MGAVVLADPAFETRADTKRRYAVPLLLLAGWAGLFGYSATYLTEDMPFRPQRVEEPADPARDAAPRRVVVVTAPEARPDEAASVPHEAPRAAAPPPPAVVASAPARPAPVQAAAPQPPATADYVGVWGPTAEACGARSRRRGYLPATITPERAQAGRTVCSFHDGRRTGNAWVMAAACSDRGRHWSSQVRLAVEGDRLTWSSGRGTSAYVRCGRRPG